MRRKRDLSFKPGFTLDGIRWSHLYGVLNVAITRNIPVANRIGTHISWIQTQRLPVAVDRCNCILRSLNERNVRAEWVLPQDDFSRVFDTFGLIYILNRISVRNARERKNYVIACGRIVVSVKRISVSGCRVRRCEKYVRSSRVGYALMLLHRLLLHSTVVNAMKCYLSFFQRYIRIPPFQINICWLQQKERERIIFFMKEMFLINRRY